MRLGNTPRKQSLFYVEGFKSFAFGMLFTQQDGTAYDVTDKAVRLVITDVNGTEVVNTAAGVIDAPGGHVQFNLQAPDLALDPGSYPYDITLVPVDGYTVPLIKGSFELGSNVDQDTSNSYVTVAVDPTFTLVMDGYTVLSVGGV